MSQIKPSFYLLAIATVLALSGCGDKNPQAVFSPEAGHPENWVTGHKTAGKSNTESCFECHGDDLKGGISKVGCTDCHLGSVEKPHPLQWGSYAYARHSSYVTANGTSGCANAACHGATLDGVPNSGVSCTSCHGKSGTTYSKHPSTWSSIKDHGATVKGTGKSLLKTVNAQTTTTCSNTKCHGADLKGVFLSGPACTSCHTADPATGNFIKHPTSWNTTLSGHKTTTDYTSCKSAACHGTTLTGGSFGAPACYSCHVNYSENNGAMTKHPLNVPAWRTAHSGYVSAHKPIADPTCTNAACHLPGTRTADAYCKNCHNGK